MEQTLAKLLPVLVLFAAAFMVKQLGWLKKEYGHHILKFAFYVTIPALILVSVSSLEFTSSLLIFPVLSAVILAITFPLVLFVSKRYKLSRASEGTFKVAPMTINSGFVLPFMVAAFGGEGATRVVLFNAGFNPLLLIGVYGLAASYNPGNKTKRDVLKRIIILPPL
jgi:predicted permease